MQDEQINHRLILGGGCFLAFGAAFMNTSLFLQTGTSVSHLTGDISRLSIDAALRSPGVIADMLNVASAAVSFLAGAFLAGFLIHHPTLDIKRPYGRVIMGIGLLFFASFLSQATAPIIAISCAAFGCGLQNALATRYRGIILRTTHLTGLLTDFGTFLGMIARGYEIPKWKAAVPGVLILFFFVGGLLSCLLSVKYKVSTSLWAGILYVAGGLSWSFYKHVIMPRP
ncbi:YoaK family protein [Oscillatoria amoena NRMC-F 0135]|nr:YoaK family protein [Oscillatoria amoena NRMC-F 0135]